MTDHNSRPSEQRFNCERQPMPTCPHCGHALTDDEMHGFKPDLYALAPYELGTCIECPVCDKEYAVQGGYTPYYTSTFTEDELAYL